MTFRYLIAGLWLLSLHSIEPPENSPSRLDFSAGSESESLLADQGAEFWSESQALSWAHGQGFSLTRDSDLYGVQNRRAAVFHAPGVRFPLYAVRNRHGTLSRTGHFLVLDFAFPVSLDREKTLSSDFKNYRNILRYEIFADGIHLGTVESGYGVSQRDPLIFAIPYIRDPEGRVVVEIRLANHPAQFAILYDAVLVE